MLAPKLNNKSHSILIVEDNAADVRLIREALSQEHVDCDLRVVKDGALAIEVLDQIDADDSYPCPELILLDLNLPKVTGEEVLKRVRSSCKSDQIKVLIVSSSNAPSDKERVMKLGATDYFRKPSSLDQFMMLGPKVRSLLP